MSTSYQIQGRTCRKGRDNFAVYFGRRRGYNRSMSQLTHHIPQSIFRYRLQQVLLLLILCMMLVAGVLLLWLAVTLPAPLFALMLPFIAGLALPVFMQLSVSPPLHVDTSGITIQPFLWRARHIAWDEIAAIKAYPLLPGQDNEVVKRALVGRNNYEEAQGVMLLVPALPLQYRAVSFFVGESGQALIAVTNRSHRNYARFLKQVKQHAPHLLKQRKAH